MITSTLKDQGEAEAVDILSGGTRAVVGDEVISDCALNETAGDSLLLILMLEIPHRIWVHSLLGRVPRRTDLTAITADN